MPIHRPCILSRVTMQVLVRDHQPMIAAPVQRDIDGIPEGSHDASVPPMPVLS